MTHKPTPVASLISGQIAALDLTRAAPWMGIDASGPQPQGAYPFFAMGGTVAVMPGERYSVQRGLAVMPIRGILTPDNPMLEKYLGWATYSGIETACAELAANDDVRGVAIPMDSPGGLVRGIEMAGNAIAALAAKKPVHVLVDSLSASAAYWLAAQASDITMVPGAEVGSIGTMRVSSWPVQPDGWGDQNGIHLSSHARAKWPNPTDDTGRAEIQRSLDEAEGKFLDAVAAGRGLQRDALPGILSVTDDAADGGAIYDFEDARRRGLVDAMQPRGQFYADKFEAHAPPSGGARAVAGSGRSVRARAVQIAGLISDI